MGRMRSWDEHNETLNARWQIADFYLGNVLQEEPEALTRPQSSAPRPTPTYQSPLAEFEGEYHSEELDTRYRIEVRGDRLFMMHARLTDLHGALPAYAIEAMREAFPAFGKKIAVFDRHDAVLTGVETRTSSPIRIRRGEDFQSINTPGLYPAGEGAGFAGGILSAAVDGIKVAEAVAKSIAGRN